MILDEICCVWIFDALFDITNDMSNTTNDMLDINLLASIFELYLW